VKCDEKRRREESDFMSLVHGAHALQGLSSTAAVCHSSVLSLQRVTLPLAVRTVKQRRSGSAGSAAAGGISVFWAFAAGAGGDDTIARAGGRYAGFTLSRSLTSPASFSPSSLHFMLEYVIFPAALVHLKV